MKKLYIVLIAIVILIMDIISKQLIINNLIIGESISVIKNFFNISYIQNTGAAWGIFSSSTMLLIIFSILVLIVIIWIIVKEKKMKTSSIIAFGLLIGGLIGNLIDRIRYGYVIDFFDFKIFGYSFPVFNVADMSICIGIFLIIYLIIWGEKNEKNKSNRRRKVKN